MLLGCLVVATAFAGKEDSYVLYEGFESGTIPADWDVEFATEYQQPWVVEASADAAYPIGSYAGGYHLALRNTTSQTQHYVTRLISPVFDISATFQPILVFSHAQPQRTGDVDVLRVYYRTSPMGRWVKIGEYANRVSAWQTDTIELTAPCETYQLAFEGADNFGRGIVLDDIIVRPTPTCDDPANIMADGLSTNSVTLRWNGSLDTDSFHVVLSTVQQTDPEQPTEIVRDEYVQDFSWQATNLTQNTTYYAYIQAHCNLSQSEWVEYRFTTKNLVTLPYLQTFNLNYAAGTVSHIAYWSYGTSIQRENGSMEYMPFVNTNTKESSLGSYSCSRTTCLVFTGYRDIDTPIPAGHFVYTATPEIGIDDIRQVQLRFWGSCEQYVGDEYASGLIVGVMDDPSDFSTFVPVDTVYIDEPKSFQRFTVYFDTYQGTGKYIGFASNFQEKDNIFYLDDVEIKPYDGIKEIINVRVENYGGASFTLNANANGNQRMQLIVAADNTDPKTGKVFLDPTSLSADQILVNTEIAASQLPYTVQLPEGGRFVQVYLRATDGTKQGDFSLPLKVLVPMVLKDLPFSTDFTEEDKNKWSLQELSNFTSNTNTTRFPFCVITNVDNSCGSNNLPFIYTKDKITSCTLEKEMQIAGSTVLCKQSTGDYIAFPALGNNKDALLSFYMARYSSTVPNTSRVAIGMMTDPFNPFTFDTITTVETNDVIYRPFYISLADYKGEGIFPAIMAVDADAHFMTSSTSGSGGNYETHATSKQYIKNVQILSSGACCSATEHKFELEPTKATLTWNSLGMSKWLVSLYADAEMNTTLVSESVTTNRYVFDNLTPHTTYYYSVQTDCEGTLMPLDLYSFTTECYPAEPLPYIENFESWTGGGSNPLPEPLCWTMERVTYSDSHSNTSSYYPYIALKSQYANNAHSGDKCFYFSSFNTSSAPEILYVALPQMADDLTKLELTFYAKPSGISYVGDTLFVGVMTDPADLSTFDTVATCRMATTEYEEHIVRLNNYKGTGKHLAFALAKGKRTRTIYLDDIKVDYLSDCEKIQNVSPRGTTESSVNVYWQKGDATQWEVLLATENNLTLGSTVEVDGKKVLSITPTTTMPTLITGCPEPNTTYYLYVRSICDENNKGDWSQPVSFKTTCLPQSIEDALVIDFSNADELDCWTVGVREGTTNAPSRNAKGYLYMFNTDKSDGAYAIMPPIDIDSITRLQVSFDAHGGNDMKYLRELTVGVISNPSDLSTFTAITTLSLNRVSATNDATNQGFDEAARYTVRFNGYTGDYNGDYGKQIMFLSESGDKYNYIYIDNIKIDTIGACMEPVTVRATEINANDITLVWDDLHGDYQVQILDAAGETVIQDIPVIGKSTVRIEGLERLTNYQVQVRQLCSEEDMSIWSNRITVRTACPSVFNSPYTEDFEAYRSVAGSYPDCWEFFTSSTATTQSSLPGVYSSAKKDGKNGLHLYRTTAHYSYAVLPKMAMPMAQTMVSFDWRNSSTKNAAYMMVGVATDITSVEGIDTTFTLIDSLYAPKYAAPDNVWQYYSKTFDEYKGAEGYVVFIAPVADKSANDGCIYIDNIYIEQAPTCYRPINLEATTATNSSVTLQWTPFGKEKAWDIAYVPTGGKIEDASIITVDTFCSPVPNLAHSTTYDFYVRANCGEGDVSEWSSPISFTTVYLVALADASWNFDDVNTQHASPLNASTKIENGWIVGNPLSPTSAGNMPYNKKNTYWSPSNTRNAHYALSDSCALIIGTSTASTNGAYAVLPEVNANLDNLQIRFSGRAIHATGSKVSNTDSTYYTTYVSGNYAHSINVGTMTDPYDPSTFEPQYRHTFTKVTDAKTIVDGGYWEEVIVPLYGAAGKYIAFKSDSAQNIVYIDDVIVEEETLCAIPTRLRMDDLTFNHVSFSWTSSKQEWEVQLYRNSDNALIAQETVKEQKWATEILEPLTDYTFAVRAICTVGDTSAWVNYAFSTPCAPFEQEEFVFNFEDNLYTYVTKCDLPGCWDGGQLVKQSATTHTNMPKAIANDKSYQYSRNITDPVTDGRALRLYNTTTYYNSYVVLPELNADLDSVSLHFWARAAYFYPATANNVNNRNRLYQVNNKYQRSIVIGAIADIDDWNTFVPIDTFTYSKSFSSTNVYTRDDESGNDFWEEVLIPLKEYAGKGRIAIFYPSNGNASTFCIDDMDIVKGDFCAAATNLRALNISAYAADLAWNTAGKDSVRLQLAFTDMFEEKDIVLDTTLVDSKGRLHVENLLAGRDYYFRVQHFCGEEETADWATSAKFVTAYDLRFFQNFSITRTYPEDWQRGTGTPAEVFSGEKAVNIVSEDITANWRRYAGTTIIANNEIIAETSYSTSASNNQWLLTPVIDMTQVKTDKPLMLSFRLGLSNQNDGMPNETGEGDKFILAVSEDDGATWKAHTYWSDAADDHAAYSYAAIPYRGQLYYIDVTAYAGKRVRFAFINSSVNTGSRNYIRLATVSLNYTEQQEYRAAICQWNDYKDTYFSIDADDLVVDATTEYTFFEQAVRNGQTDTYVKMLLTVNKGVESITNDTICEGGDYMANNFVIQNVGVSQTYKQKLTGFNACDSVSTLQLYVRPRIRTEVRETRCQGDYCEFNGVKYYTSTIHTDTLSSVQTGCDSIVTLYLTVNAILSGEEEAHLCPGQSVAFGKFGNISEAGEYVDTLTTALRCDSVATLRVYTHPAESSTKRAAICQGEKYIDDVWNGVSKAGDYPSKQTTIWGCDSTVTLHLLVADASLTLTDTISPAQLPYVLNDTELLPEGTAEGTYTRTVSLTCGEAVITITVGEPLSVPSVFVNSLALTPNPVHANAPIRVMGSFASDASLDVIASTGECIYHSSRLGSPIVIPGIPATGVYIVTVTSNGQVYQSKLIVL